MYSQRLLERALDVLAPCHCSLCGLPSGRAINLCLACEGELPWLTTYCRQCALPLASDLAPGAGAVCGRCLTSPPAFDHCIAACAYTPPFSRWLHAGKYQGDFASLRVMAYLLRRALSDLEAHTELPQLVVPMPLHWRRRWQRGFNQAEELARELKRHPHFAALKVDRRLVKRIRPTQRQRELGLAERRRNLRNAFEVTRPLAGESVVIIDDVLTTGASADALARALKNQGAGRVGVWCCARTPRPE